jgi:O-antigen/teichoic acid export membrane protein
MSSLSKSLVSTGFFVSITQLISFFSLPYIGFLAGPDEFGLYNYLTAYVVIFSVIISLKSEYLFYVLDDSDRNKVWAIFNLVILSITVIFFTYLCITKFSNFYFVIGVWAAILSYVYFEFIIQDNVSRGEFKKNSINRVLRAILFPFFCFVIHFLFVLNASGILFSFAISSLTPLLTNRDQKIDSIKQSVQLIKSILPKVIHNAYTLVPAHFLKQYSIFSVLIIGGFFGANNFEMGIFSMAFKFIISPTAIISTAVGEIFRKKLKDDLSGALAFYKKIVFYIVPIAAIGLFIVSYFGVFIESYLLSGRWNGISDYFTVLSPLAFVLVCLSPFTYIYIAVNKQEYDLYWQILNSIIVTLSLLVGFSFGFYYGVFMYSVSYSCSIILSSVICFKLIKGVK